MSHEALTLYHGSSVGWLHLSGFMPVEFAYGELDRPSNYVFLCTKREGAESAAFKAFGKVHDRNKSISPSNKYIYDGVQYTPGRFVYSIEVQGQARVLDFSAPVLSQSDKLLVKMAVGSTLKSLRARLSSGCWRIRNGQELQRWLNHAFDDTALMVNALGQVGFDFIRNFERDGDGQGYGEVWVLPLNRVVGKNLQKPVECKCPRRPWENW